MKLKPLSFSLALLGAAILAGCGGGSASNNADATGSQFMTVQGSRNIQAVEGDVIGVTATGISSRSPTVNFSSWTTGPQTSIETVRGNAETGIVASKAVLQNAECTDFSTSGTDNTDTPFRSEGRRTCTVFVKLPTINRATEKVHLVFNAEDAAGNSVKADFFIDVVQSPNRAPGSNPVTIGGETRRGSSSTTDSTVQLVPGESVTLRLKSQGTVVPIQSASFVQTSGPSIALTNADCAVNAVNQGVYTCDAGFTAPSNVTSFTRYTFTATAQDQRGNTNTIPFNLVLSPTGFGPLTANATPETRVGTPLVLAPNTSPDFSCFASGGEAPYRIMWELVRPTNNATAPVIPFTTTSINDGTGSRVSFTTPNQPIQGTYKLVCKVTDNKGVTPAVNPEVNFVVARSDFGVSVNFTQADSGIPTTRVVDQQAIINLGSTVTDSTGAAIPKTGFAFRWELLDGSNLVQTSNAQTFRFTAPTHTDRTDKTYTVKLCATTNQATTNACVETPKAEDTFLFKVRPATDATTGTRPSFTANPLTVNPGGDVTLDASASTAFGGGVTNSDITYLWSFTPPTGGSVSDAVFTSPTARVTTMRFNQGAKGDYIVRLTTNLKGTNGQTRTDTTPQSEEIRVRVFDPATTSVRYDAGQPFDVVLPPVSSSVSFILNGSRSVVNSSSNRIAYSWNLVGAVPAGQEAFASDLRGKLNTLNSVNGTTTNRTLTFDSGIVAGNTMFSFNFELKIFVDGAEVPCQNPCNGANNVTVTFKPSEGGSILANATVAPTSSEVEAGQRINTNLDGTRTTIGGREIGNGVPSGFKVRWIITTANQTIQCGVSTCFDNVSANFDRPLATNSFGVGSHTVSFVVYPTNRAADLERTSASGQTVISVEGLNMYRQSNPNAVFSAVVNVNQRP